MDIFPDNLPVFFKGINIKITIGKNIEGEYHGGTYSNTIRIKRKKVNGKKVKRVVCIPDIYVVVIAPDENELREKLSVALGHELTHAYDLYKSKLKNLSHDPYNPKYRYEEISAEINNNYSAPRIKKLAYVLYFLNRPERNAYIGQLYQELYQQRFMIKDSKSALKAITSTLSYQNVYESLDFVINDWLKNYDKKGAKQDKTTKEIMLYKKQIIDGINRITGKKFTTWNQLVNYFSDRWIQWEKAYMSNASKIAYDIYEKMHPYADGIHKSPFTNNNDI